jgi:hypothetical protein
VLLLRKDLMEGKQARVYISRGARWGDGEKRGTGNRRMSVVLDMMRIAASCQWEPKKDLLDGLA